MHKREGGIVGVDGDHAVAVVDRHGRVPTSIRPDVDHTPPFNRFEEVSDCPLFRAVPTLVADRYAAPLLVRRPSCAPPNVGHPFHEVEQRREVGRRPVHEPG